MVRIVLVLLFAALASPGFAEEKPLQPDERDVKVIDAALLHLLANPEFEMLSAKRRDDKDTVALINTGPDKTGFLHDTQIEGELDNDKQVDPKLIAATFLRNKKSGYDAVKVSFDGVKFDPRIEIVDLTKFAGGLGFEEAFRKAHPTARGFVALHLPGYSKDGNQAFVRGHAGPSPHGACVMALLELREGKWVVKWSVVSFFA